MKRSLAVLPLALALALLFSALPARAMDLPTGPEVPAQLDLNSATKAQLKALPGIGEALARRILRCRAERPLADRDELHERCGVPKAVYGKVKHMVTARQAKK